MKGETKGTFGDEMKRWRRFWSCRDDNGVGVLHILEREGNVVSRFCWVREEGGARGKKETLEGLGLEWKGAW